MSRSYKKHPLLRDCLWGKSMKRGKQNFNRKLRRAYKDPNKELYNGSYYKRINSNYELYEYKHLQTEKEVILDWYKNQQDILNGVNTWKAKWLEKYSLEEDTLGKFINYEKARREGRIKVCKHCEQEYIVKKGSCIKNKKSGKYKLPNRKYCYKCSEIIKKEKSRISKRKMRNKLKND